MATATGTNCKLPAFPDFRPWTTTQGVVHMSDDKIFTQSAYTAVIHAPIDQVDIADWLLNLPDAEYQRCAPPDHIAAGSTTTDDGQPRSINVEEAGGGLVVQHYVAE